MTTVFGAVVEDYDQLRPGYSDSIAATIAAALDAVPAGVTEIGAGTGKATAVFQQIGAPLTCLEPDGRMAARLAQRFPDATVVQTTLENWTPPTAGVPLIVGALVWHLFDPRRRCELVHDALVPNGIVALVGRKNVVADADQAAAIRAAFDTYGWAIGSSPLDWISDDLAASGLFDAVSVSRHDTTQSLACADYLRLVSTYSRFQALAPDLQERLLAALGDAVAAGGGIIREHLQTTLHIARCR